MTIAVDFDGTIVEHRYPQIGRELPFATATLRQLMADGHRLILWSVRQGKLLDEAVAFCEQRGVRFYAVNQDYDGDTPEANRNHSRKLKADLWIDDRQVGGLPDWGTIYQLISRRITLEELLVEQFEREQAQPKRRRRWGLF